MKDLLEKIISLAKRRGFVFLSSEIYGGFSSCYDFGPLGVEMKNNIKKLWWEEMTRNKENIFGLDSSILMRPEIWQASGHLTAGFADELVECKKCHKRFKADEIKRKCPECGGNLTAPKKFNLMMKTFVGPVEDETTQTYLRAETCQGIYVNFKNILNSTRTKIPFGVCQIGKAFRNEITPKNFLYRIREFEQMEMQWFCHPKETKKWFDFWLRERLKWLKKIGIKSQNLRIVEVPKEERAHYARRQIDIQYKFPFGWREIEGVHNRGDWDLSNHSKHSGKDLSYFDRKTGKKYFPFIIETSIGVERLFFALLCEAYEEIPGGRTKTTKSTKEVEILLRLNKKVAPIKIAVLPLVKNKPEIVQKAKEIYKMLKPHFNCQYDEGGSIGRRYRRQDEIGTPFAITVDFDTLKKDDVTIRDRDTMEQERIKIKDLISVLKRKLEET
jgi:glycyl-tRNA synthetase